MLVSLSISFLAFEWGHQTTQIKAPVALKSHLLQQRSPIASYLSDFTFIYLTQPPQARKPQDPVSKQLR